MASKKHSTKKFVPTDRLKKEIAKCKLKEEALQENERRFRDVAEVALEWIWEVDHKGKYTYVNSVVEKVLGYKPEEVIKKYFYDLFHSEDRERLKRVMFDVFSQKKPFREFIHRAIHKNKKEVWLSTSGVPMLDKKGRVLGYRGVDINITGRRKVEEKLLTSEEKFRLIFEGAKDAIMWLESETGKIIKCNKAAEILLEKGRDNIIGYNQEDFYLPAKKNYYAKLFQERIKQKRVFDEDMEIITGAGKIKSVRVTASMTSVGGGRIIQAMFHDITEQKRAEKALLESEKKLSEIFNGISDGLILVNKKGYIVEANKSLLEVSGYKREELVGKHILKTGAYIDNKSKKLILDAFLKRITIGNKLKTAVVDFKTKRGEIKKTEITSSLIRKEGKIDSMVVLLKDVTERARMENEMKESEKKFRGLFERANDGFIYLDNFGKISDCNKKTAKIFGGTKKDLLGKNFTKLGIFSAKDIPRLLTNFRNVLAGKETRLELVIKNKKGQEILLEALGTVISISGKIHGVFVIVRDITERKKIEKNLKENEEKYRNLVENMKDSVSIVDVKGRILFGNKASEKLTGYKLKEKIGQSVFDVLPKEQLPFYMKKITEALKRKAFLSFETEVINKAGKRIPVETSGQLIDYGGKRAIQIVTRNISERKKAEREMSRLSSAVKTFSDSIVISNMKGKIIDVNDATLKMYGTDDKGVGIHERGIENRAY
jgi:PAS domain S-box-containing protein